MQKFHDTMTDDELLALNDQEIDDCAKILLLKEGRPLPFEMPKVESPKEALEMKASGHVYQVGQFYFDTEEAAKKCLDTVNGSLRMETEYLSGGIGHLHRFPDNGDYTPRRTVHENIEVIPTYSRAVINDVKQQLDKKDRNSELLDQWKEANDEFTKARSAVLQAVWAAQSRKAETVRREAYMAECLRLASNDQVIATRFFEQRYPASREGNSEDV